MFWPNQSALLNATHRVKKGLQNSVGQYGIISLEVPLSTRHIMVTDYSYVEADKWSNGNNTVFYNGDQLVQSFFKSISDVSGRNLLRDTVDISVDIVKFRPFGVHYIHQYDDGNTVSVFLFLYHTLPILFTDFLIKYFMAFNHFLICLFYDSFVVF